MGSDDDGGYDGACSFYHVRNLLAGGHPTHQKRRRTLRHRIFLLFIGNVCRGTRQYIRGIINWPGSDIIFRLIIINCLCYPLVSLRHSVSRE